MFAAARVLFLAYFNICLFRKRPQDIPESTDLLALTLAAYLLVATLLLALSESLERSLLSALMETVVLVLFSMALLKLTGKVHRWVQTLTALSGTGLVLTLVALPVYLLLASYGVGASEDDPIYTLALLVMAALALWNVAVMAHILKNALDTGTFTSVMLSISYIWIIMALSASLLPAESA